ncbi:MULTISPECIES: response regulator [unclassified Moorena]|uniref:response regulator n=1 Tax=unclassified Moorena TaxID=2683338 RepID=UPI0013C137ED|nr:MULTISPECIES: response regulator [unclassified Moorena]NEO06427.1 response regulator [Moorena sp. SIO3I8]NEO22767.1 response regulator [Moorena sp. SIO4A5]NEQ61749.1 response regulator [Moorena sp. SIO4A1]
MNDRNAIQRIEILLVEDNHGDVDLTKATLKNSNIRNNLQTFSNGKEAMAFLRRESPYTKAPRPDVILLDLNLPVMDGREVLAQIKSDPKLSLIPVIILTSSDSDQDILTSYKLNANAYVTKPLELEQFVKVLKSIENFWLSIVKLPPKN